MISWFDECALKQNRAWFRRLFLQCCHGAGMTIATPFSSGNVSFIFILWGKLSPSAASTSDWGMQLCLQRASRGRRWPCLWLPWATLSPSEDLPSIISCFRCQHIGDWQAVLSPVLWLVATGRKERPCLKERLPTQFLWTGRTVPSVSGQRDKSSSKLEGKDGIRDLHKYPVQGIPKQGKTTKKMV